MLPVGVEMSFNMMNVYVVSIVFELDTKEAPYAFVFVVYNVCAKDFVDLVKNFFGVRILRIRLDVFGDC